MMLIRSLAVAALMVVAACSGRHEPAAPVVDSDGAARGSAQEQDDQETLARLEREARQLARTDGCSSAAQCAAAPLGAKACGGPRAYVPYCPLTTDTTALFAKLAELERFEREYNTRYGIISDCMLVTEPPLAIENGHCVAR